MKARAFPIATSEEPSRLEMHLPIIMRFIILLFWICLPTPFHPAAHAGIPVTLSGEQLFEFDETGMVTLTPDQQEKVSAVKGFSPSRIRPVYDEPDGGTSATGQNLALRTGDNTAEIYLKYLVSDEEAKARVAEWKARSGRRQNPKKYFSYLVDADGRMWKHVSREQVAAELKRERKHLGAIGVHRPTSLIDGESIAARDTLRSLRRLLKHLGLGSYEVTKKSR